MVCCGEKEKYYLNPVERSSSLLIVLAAVSVFLGNAVPVGYHIAALNAPEKVQITSSNFRQLKNLISSVPLHFHLWASCRTRFIHFWDHWHRGAPSTHNLLRLSRPGYPKYLIRNWGIFLIGLSSIYPHYSSSNICCQRFPNFIHVLKKLLRLP